MGVTNIRLIVLNTQFYKKIQQPRHIHTFKMLYIQPQSVSMVDFVSRPQRRLPCRRTFDMFSPFSTALQSAGVQPVVPKRVKKTVHRTIADEKFPKTISINLTGFKPKDIKINMTKSGTINVVAQQTSSGDHSGRMFQQMRCFHRSVKVPDHVLAQGVDKIKSVLTDGVLELTFPVANDESQSIVTESPVATAVEQSSPVAENEVSSENNDRQPETCQIEVSHNDEK